MTTLRNFATLVVLSGGQDSTTCLFWAMRRFTEVHAVTFDYNQRHRLEIEAAKTVAMQAGVASHEIIGLPNCLKSTSPLTAADQELERYTDYNQMDQTIGHRVELTFVPMRNPLFLTVAVNRAVELGCGSVVTGICQEDNANYPDCRERFRSFFQSMANAALGTPNTLQIVAPLMDLDKAATVKLAYSMPECWAALAHTHTSYDGKYPPTDMNHANVLRAHGFEEADLPDPLVLRAWQEGLMELPQTANYEHLRLKR